MLLAKHQGRAHELAIEPGSPHIVYTCGEDGLVQHVSFLYQDYTAILISDMMNAICIARPYDRLRSF